jgi:translation initiation factor 5A
VIFLECFFPFALSKPHSKNKRITMSSATTLNRTSRELAAVGEHAPQQHEYVAKVEDFQTSDFDATDSGASLTFPLQAGDLKKGSHVCVSGHPCKVTEVEFVKPGKHGHAKATFTAEDIFTGRKYEDSAPTGHVLAAPFVKRTEYLVTDVDTDGETVALMDDCGAMRYDLNLPEDAELRVRLVKGFASGKEVTAIVLRAMGMERILGIKEAEGKA